MADSKEKISTSSSPGGSTPHLVSSYASDPAPTTDSTKRTWHSYVWSSWDLPKEEAWFLTKLDITLISSAALGVMIRYLDQVNITNAFNSGMKEDLQLYGNELNYANAFWSAAYVFGQVPSNLLLTRVNASYYIAALELAWTIATFATASITKTSHLYAVRFLVGLFEAGHFPAVMYVCSSYYKPHELARRNTLIQIATQIGPLFSGFLMAAVYAGLDGHNGLPGWRWLFIICGCVSLPCALWTAIAMPKLPARARPNWLFSQEELDLARRRMPSEAKVYTGLFKWRDILRWHKTWHVWLFPVAFLCAGQLGQSGGSMIFWVKSYNVKGKPAVFSVADVNLIPLGINVLTIVLSLTASWISDNLRGARRWPVLVFGYVCGIIIPVALAATPVHPTHRAQRWALYYLMSLASCTAGITWTYVNETSRHDPEKRAYVSAMMNAISYIFIAWVPIFTFPTKQQPYIVTGNYVNAGFAATGVLLALTIGWFDERDRKRAARAHDGSTVVTEEATEVKG